MKAKINIILLFSVLFSCLTAIGHTNPPPMGMPKENNKMLIDKIVLATEHEKYFIDYCTKKVKNYATENNWTSEKKEQILESINFKYYNYTIYNSYAFYSSDQLKKILDAIVILNENPKNKLTMILTNSMMQSNLELFVESVIKGKYVTTK
ncbi:hypothetical protein DBB36_13210 [Flavobacterium sp. WLB]|uniref:hypothetical protein n=1 Tax=unclassified Flavobacterium TaxID=196869 RepID=UPI0006AB944F|nr:MULTISPECIES: hypothetical protein [unclassified Flavobacterium]KOP40102.1 hypothetical protein AKO67_00250 [Flavobacterium sp. VMW]OWU91513.1 hypothetical protein APR43_08630 [Flavobacterium sp. NLM]PUU69508.1 hypothetical protein DBB36_13210 [Flavobacterium sp. WLB]